MNFSVTEEGDDNLNRTIIPVFEERIFILKSLAAD
jgi:hypothetical protein